MLNFARFFRKFLYMYTYDTTVFSPFCDSDYYLTGKYCFYYIQEVAGRREMSVGTGIPALLKENKSWVLLSTHLEFYKKVYWQTPIHLVTEGYKPVGMAAPRRVMCVDDEGDEVFRGDSIFAVVGIEDGKHRLIKPNEVTDRSTYDDDPAIPFAPRFRKFNIDDYGTSYVVKHKVLHTDCDINGHMNNLKYTSWMISCLPSNVFEGENDVQEMDVVFSHELYLNDEVDIKVCFDEKNSTPESKIYYVAIGEASYGKIKIGKVRKGKMRTE